MDTMCPFQIATVRFHRAFTQEFLQVRIQVPIHIKASEFACLLLLRLRLPRTKGNLRYPSLASLICLLVEITQPIHRQGS